MRKNKLLLLLVLLMTAATGAWATDGIACSASDIGKVLCTDGSIYATVGDATTAQKTAVAMIAYIDATNNKGLAIALADESGMKDYEAAGTACSGKAAVTGGTWRLPSDKDWQYMFIGCGSSESYSAPTYDPHMSKSYSGLASKLTTAQGAALQSDFYWSSTKDEPNGAWGVVFEGSNATFYMEDKTVDHKVRACLEFDAPATYTVSLNDGTENPTTWTASTDGTNFGALPIGGLKGDGSETVTLKYNGRLKVKGVKATSDEKPAEATPALSITSPSVGQVIGSDGKNYAYGSLPTGVTAVAKICYVSGSNGLALALTDEGLLDWSTAIETCAAHTPAFTGGTWKLASQNEWDNMISDAGSDTALRDGFSSVGGTNMQSGFYWSSSLMDYNRAWGYRFYYSHWGYDDKGLDYYVRACLAF